MRYSGLLTFIQASRVSRVSRRDTAQPDRTVANHTLGRLYPMPWIEIGIEIRVTIAIGIPVVLNM